MATTLFVIPLKKGKIETYKDFLHQCLGPKQTEYKDMLLRYGCNTLKMWLHNINDTDYAIFAHEMSDNAPELLKSWSTSTNPFDQWFDQQLRDCYDIIDINHLPPQPTFIGEIDAR